MNTSKFVWCYKISEGLKCKADAEHLIIRCDSGRDRLQTMLRIKWIPAFFLLSTLSMVFIRGRCNEPYGFRKIHEGMLWPGAYVPYDVHPELASEPKFTTVLMAVIMKIQENSCVRFVPMMKGRKFLYFTPRKGTVRFVGYLPSETSDEVSIDSFDPPEILRIVMYAIGVEDELHRPRAEVYYDVINRGIINDDSRALESGGYRNDSLYLYYPPYSLKTVMHYPLKNYTTGSTQIVTNCKDWKYRKYDMDRDIDYDLDRIRGLYRTLYRFNRIEACNTCGHRAKYIRCSFIINPLELKKFFPPQPNFTLN